MNFKIEKMDLIETVGILFFFTNRYDIGFEVRNKEVFVLIR